MNWIQSKYQYTLDSSRARWKHRSLLINWCFSFLWNAHWCVWCLFQRRISCKMLTVISRVSYQASSKPLIYLFNAWGRSVGRQRALCLSIRNPRIFICCTQSFRLNKVLFGCWLTLCSSSLEKPGVSAMTSFFGAIDNFDLNVFMFHFQFPNFTINKLIILKRAVISVLMKCVFKWGINKVNVNNWK